MTSLSQTHDEFLQLEFKIHENEAVVIQKLHFPT